MKILNIVGTRPNFIKIAPIIAEMNKTNRFTPLLLHTGQHYDENMSLVFFDQLGIPRPDYDLGVGSGSIPGQIAEIIKNFEPVLKEIKPDAVLVVGDVNSTLACAMVAAYERIPVIHVEAGLRSFDRNMPEELNRLLTDKLADFLFITEKSAQQNLEREGIDPEKIHFVGNVMVDTLLKHRPMAEKNAELLKQYKLTANKYAVLTMHRPSNVDCPKTLKSIMEGIAELAEEIPVVFPIHPRTEKRIKEYNLSHLMEPLLLVPPQSYMDMLQLMAKAALVLTDSGGIQEESTILDVPCLTIRENTERPVTIDQGTNTLVGTETKRILEEAQKILRGKGKKGQRPELWDGSAAKRIIMILSEKFG